MAHTFLMLHLVAVFVGVQVVGTYTSYGGGGADNGHSAKKAPMDYSRYADDVRNIANHHDSDFNSHRSNTCDDRFELKNSTIIRTKDSMYSGAQFVDDMKVAGATECRRQCCKNEESCDTAIFVDDDTKDKNCFLFKCRIDDSIKCKFANHVGYVSAMVGGFEVVPRSRIETESDRGDDDNDKQRNEEEGDVKTGFDVKQETAATPEDDDASNQDEEAVVDDDGCGDGKIQCANGDCIISRYVCNDIEDCTDGSDEMGCKYDTNTPSSSSHSSHATNHPKIGPNPATNQGQQEQTKAPKKMRLDDIRSELASELHEQSSPDDGQRDAHDDDKTQDADRKQESDKNKSDRADEDLQSLQDGDEVDERDGENYDDGDAGAAKDTDEASKAKVPDSDYVEPNSREHQVGDQPDTSDELADWKPNLHHPSDDEEDLKEQAQGNDDFRSLKTHSKQDERLDDKEHPKMSDRSDDQIEPDQEQRGRQQSNKESKGYTYPDEDAKYHSQSARVDSKHRPVLPNDERDDPNYTRQQIRHKNPIGPDITKEKGTPDRLNYYPDSDSRENLYPYDNYDTNFNGKPYPDTPDYNYRDTMFEDVRAGDPGRDRYDNRNPLYQDLQDDRFDPDQENYINYHRRDRLNNNYNYPVEDPPPEERRLRDRPPLYDHLPVEDDWNRREDEGDSGMGDGDRGQGRQRGNGRPYQGRFKPDDATSSQQNRAGGSWKHWNNYNHPDSTYPDDDDRDRSDEGVNRESEVDEAVNQDDVDDSNKGNEAKQDKRPEDSVLPTEMDNQLSDIDDSQDVPPQSSPEPAVEPVQEVSSNLVDPEGEEGHPSSVAVPTVVNMPKVVSGMTEEGTSKVDDLGDQTLRKVTPHGIQPATSAILPLAVGLIITLFLLMMLSCRLRYMNRRLRYGRLKTHAHDADYLINGMYL